MSTDPEPDEPAATVSPDASRGRLAWLPAAPGALALVAAVLPWFAPTGAGVGRVRLDIPRAFCWQAGRIGFLAPLVIVGVCVAVLGPRHGWFGKDQPPRTLRADGLLLAGAGVVAGAVLVATWYLLPASYTFSGLTWDTLVAAGYAMHRGPQPGFWIAVVAAVAALGSGIALVLIDRRTPRAG